ncbi:hypothetical protein ACU18_18850, partial [Arthrobacter sp. ZBG10]|uniref:hypothetical protein n=1 Tax=Arthrobacter sp. ZBG10 TaxID=1676590 RepID=UPI0006A46ACE
RLTLTVPATKPTVACGTITIRLTITVATTETTARATTSSRPVTVRLPLPATKATVFTVTAGTVTKRLTVAVTEGLTLTVAGWALCRIVVVPVFPSPEAAGIPAGVVVSPE